jgi:hypothetical protein
MLTFILEGFIVGFERNDDLSGVAYERNVAVSHFFIVCYSYNGNAALLRCEFLRRFSTATEWSQYAGDIDGQIACKR